eukprot:gene7745-12215_t
MKKKEQQQKNPHQPNAQPREPLENYDIPPNHFNFLDSDEQSYQPPFFQSQAQQQYQPFFQTPQYPYMPQQSQQQPQQQHQYTQPQQQYQPFFQPFNMNFNQFFPNNFYQQTFQQPNPNQPLNEISQEKLIENSLKKLLLDEIEEEQIKFEDKEEKNQIKKKKKKKINDNFKFSDNRNYNLPEYILENSLDLSMDKDTANKMNKQLQKLYKSLLPSKIDEERKQDFFEKLKLKLQKVWPDSQIYMFGSSASNLCVKGKADIDVCFVIEMKDIQHGHGKLKNKKKLKKKEEEEQEIVGDEEIKNNEKYIQQSFRKTFINHISGTIKKNYMIDVIPLLNARIPIVKFKDPVTEIGCDICVNNLLAVHNTQLLKSYSLFDERFKQLVYIVKYWSKLRNLNEPYQGTLSSYAYVLLIIHYLQNLNERVLPNLQDFNEFNSMKPNTIVVDEYDCTFFKDIFKIEKSKNKELTSQLLTGFFKYYAYQFDYSNKVVSIKKSNLTKEEKKWTNSQEQRNYFCIEDPFESDFDVGRCVTIDGLELLKNEFIRAFVLLCKKSDFKKISSKINV